MDICSKFQINLLRIVRDIYARIFLIFGDSLTLLLSNYLTLAGSRGSFDPKNKNSFEIREYIGMGIDRVLNERKTFAIRPPPLILNHHHLSFDKAMKIKPNLFNF